MLPTRLKGGTVVPVWSEHAGYKGGSFKFLEIDKDGAAVVDPPLRRISKNDFAFVYRIWGEYRKGIYPRSKITAQTVNSTCIIGILRWLDDRP